MVNAVIEFIKAGGVSLGLRAGLAALSRVASGMAKSEVQGSLGRWSSGTWKCENVGTQGLRDSGTHMCHERAPEPLHRHKR